MPSKRKARVDNHEDEDFGDDGGGTQGQGAAAVAVAKVLDDETADKLAHRLCRFVLLSEHKRKPLSRTDIKAAVMAEHNDRSGKIFKQVLHVANERLRDIVGLELMPEKGNGGEGGGDVDDEGVDASQAVPGASQSQAGPSQIGGTQGAAAAAKASSKGGLYLLVNKLAEPVTAPPNDSMQIYYAFVEVVLTLLQQSDGTLEEEALFEYLGQLGLDRDAALPQQALIADKVGNLVQKRLVTEAYLKRTKKEHQADIWQYEAGSRAAWNRNIANADAFRDQILGTA